MLHLGGAERLAHRTWRQVLSAGYLDSCVRSCLTPPFCLDVVGRAHHTYHVFYFPMQYMLFW